MHRATRILTFLLLSCVWAAPALAQVVISEFRTRGPAGGNDEFIEIFKASGSAVNIGGWKINGSNSSGTTSTRVTVNAGVILNAGCYYLVTNSVAGGYSGAVAGDQTFSVGVADNGGIGLLTAADVIVDQVGMSAGSAYKEGTTLAPMSLNQNQSYERLPGGGSGNGTDTNNNSADFVLNATTSNASNQSSTCIAPTPVNGSTWGTIKTMYR
jgi:hypothetical protein